MSEPSVLNIVEMLEAKRDCAPRPSLWWEAQAARLIASIDSMQRPYELLAFEDPDLCPEFGE